VNILITGAYGGIGRAVCHEYAILGCHLFITGKDNDKLECLAKSLREKYSIEVVVYIADLTLENEIKSLFLQIRHTFNTLDILVHCAGSLTDRTLMMMRFNEIEQDIAVNLTSAILLCQYGVKLMAKNKSGVITLMSSVVAAQGSAGQSIYGASKAGIEGLTKSLSKEFGLLGIRVNAIAPGFIDTPLVAQYSEENKTVLADKTSLGRIGLPEDIAPVVSFLSSKKASYITGQIIAVDGGLVL